MLTQFRAAFLGLTVLASSGAFFDPCAALEPLKELCESGQIPPFVCGLLGWLLADICDDDDGGEVKFHVSNSGNFTIEVHADGELVGTVPSQSSSNFFPEIEDPSSCLVEVISGAQVLGSEQVSVNPQSQQVDISYLNGQVYISVNPISGNRPANPPDRKPLKPTPDPLFSARPSR